MSQGTSPLPKDKGPTTEPGKAVGIKRLQSDTPSSPGYHNVYVRRKVESEHSKVNPSQDLKGNGRDKTKEQETHQDVQQDQQEQANRTQVASPVAESVEIVSSKSPEKTNVEIVPETKAPEKTNVDIVPETKAPEKTNVDIVPETKAPEKPNVEIVPEITAPEKPNVEIVPEKTEPPVASGTGIQEDVKQLSIQYWNERFNRLQTYLESCDHSTHEGYLRKLRSLSAAGRSMHAIELEKRAIHLLVEEGKELQRMKALNVLGKVSPNASSKPTPLQRQCQK